MRAKGNSMVRHHCRGYPLANICVTIKYPNMKKLFFVRSSGRFDTFPNNEFQKRDCQRRPKTLMAQCIATNSLPKTSSIPHWLTRLTAPQPFSTRGLCFTALFMLLLPFSLMAQHHLTGNLTDKDGQIIQDAEVSLLETNQSTSTNALGVFAIKNIPTGNYTLEIQAEGYRLYQASIKLNKDIQLDLSLSKAVYQADEVRISATRASEQTATTYDELDNEEVRKRNFGQDFPFILGHMPSAVITSDAGAGIGYTGIRIRGTDATRINVTINGVPLNDAESHGVFWVNLPDFASSVNNVQVQRGVGTSTNGAAAFGASINIQTNALAYEPYVELTNAYGSFNSWKNTLSASTGLIDEKFSLDVRLSNIVSDGWVDRASSDLKSFFVSGTYYGNKSQLKLNVFSGRERTYQSWWGTPEALVKGDAPGLEDHITRNFYTEAQIANLRNSDRRYNFYEYDNQVDNYGQDHYQLFYTLEANESLDLNLGLHYTHGQGFFEEFKEGEDFASYGLPDIQIENTVISSTDLIRRRWLDNDFYGFTYSANYQPNENLQLTLGGGYNRYDGDHFGEIIWAQYASTANIRHQYYQSRGLKADFNTYLKGIFQISPKLSAYADLQLRLIDYEYGDEDLKGPGTDNDLKEIQGMHNYTFFNPKAGLTYRANQNTQLYASFAISNREPVRSDFIDAPQGRTPLHETLYNLEAGYRLKGSNYAFTANYFLMSYENQLVLNGEVNDVGASVRQNVENSYRTGIEIAGHVAIVPSLVLSGNIAYSANKIKNFTEVILDYADFSTVENQFENTDISFSPNLIAGGSLSFIPSNNLDISLLGKYVSKQYLDNTSNEDRAIDAFFVSDFRITYDLQPSWAKNIRVGLLINNLFDTEYEANGYTYSYNWEGFTTTENFLYPQAGRNLMVSLGLRF